jgi:hypothetical protein
MIQEDVIATKELITGKTKIRGEGKKAQLLMKTVTCTIPASQGTTNVTVASDFFEEGMVILHGFYKIISMTDTFPESIDLDDDGGTNLYLTKQTGGIMEGTVTNCNFGNNGKTDVLRNTDSIGATDLGAKLDGNCGANPLVFEVTIVYIIADYD